MKVYVRTKDGYIGEIVEVGKYTLTMSINGVIRYVDIDNVKKTSPLILELIEFGDYVNGDMVIKTVPKDKRKKQEIIIDSTLVEYGELPLRQEDIKSIITKEQFAKGEFIL